MPVGLTASHFFHSIFAMIIQYSMAYYDATSFLFLFCDPIVSHAPRPDLLQVNKILTLCLSRAFLQTSGISFVTDFPSSHYTSISFHSAMTTSPKKIIVVVG